VPPERLRKRQKRITGGAEEKEEGRRRFPETVSEGGPLSHRKLYFNINVAFLQQALRTENERFADKKPTETFEKGAKHPKTYVLQHKMIFFYQNICTYQRKTVILQRSNSKGTY